MESQLVMYRRNLEGIPELELPPGYSIRYYDPGDEVLLAPIFMECFDPGWSAERIVKTFLEDNVWSPNRMSVLCFGDEVIGTASAWESPARPAHGLLHYLAVLPAHRGKHLGYMLAGTVLRNLLNMGYTDCWLTTDDFRLPAIRIYLSVGFSAALKDPTHRDRWEVIKHKLRAGELG